MKTNEIPIRDPFILPVDGVYYLYSNAFDAEKGGPVGFQCRKSTDLIHWSEPISIFRADETFWSDTDYWAPEVHAYNGKYYLFASFYTKDKSRNRGTQILRADAPEGPFVPISDGPATPADWMCLDGTLYLENGKPHMVFCHEWVQIHDGTICAMPLTDDLSAPAGEPVLLFSAKSCGWADPIDLNGCADDYVTDGPFLWKDEDGLWMFWASFIGGDYAEGIALSKSGSVYGPWEHCEPLFRKDGGHGMLFRDFSGQLRFVLHQPNHSPDERAVFFTLQKENGVWSAEPYTPANA